MAEQEAPEAGRRLHVTVLLVASRRALDNALGELGFTEDDDRVIEHDGRLAFLTCTHEDDCDDLFALITELSTRGESWELQSRIDTETGRAVYQSLARHRPVEAVDAAVDEEAEPDPGEAPALDVEAAEGLQALKRLLRRVDPAEVFATIRPGREGRATARVLRRGSRRLVVAATASDEATLRGVLREILPSVMLDVAMKPPS
ncbi:MAG TPA: hypothetical protein VHY35_19820 [Stellaceae bacterium]|jgi:hypothetical protein|nr:hypothetical protein [Stellaceae bacterium]